MPDRRSRGSRGAARGDRPAGSRPAARGFDPASSSRGPAAAETAPSLHDFSRLPGPAGFEPPSASALQAKLTAPPVQASVLKPSGGGKQLPDGVRTKMESSLGADFSGVRVHEGSEAPSIGALAYTRGSNIHFAPGRYQPNNSSGQKLLGHELTHVVQQRQGRVRAPSGGGVPINDSPSLEREADKLGTKAASSSVPRKSSESS